MGRLKTATSAIGWHHWLVAATVLFAIGVGALVVLGGGTSNNEGGNLLGLLRRPTTATGTTHTLAYSAWLLSWLSAIVSIGMAIWKVLSEVGR